MENITTGQIQKIHKIANYKGLKDGLEILEKACHLLETLVINWEDLSFHEGKLLIKKFKRI